jgi:hypothetical protein
MPEVVETVKDDKDVKDTDREPERKFVSEWTSASLSGKVKLEVLENASGGVAVFRGDSFDVTVPPHGFAVRATVEPEADTKHPDVLTDEQLLEIQKRFVAAPKIEIENFREPKVFYFAIPGGLLRALDLLEKPAELPAEPVEEPPPAPAYTATETEKRVY